MRELLIEDKTGFSSLLPFKIFDVSGKVFYDSEFTDNIKNGKRLFFNLPVGKYTYNGLFMKEDKPVKYERVDLPLKQRNKTLKRYKIIFGNNPNKCTIFYKRGIILFDNSLKDFPLYIKYYIYYHELGHHYYRTEHLADRYATRIMLEKGFNKSQIGRAILFALSEKQLTRKKKVVKSIKNI